MVVGCLSDYASLLRLCLDRAFAVEGVDYHEGVVSGGIGELHHRGPFGRGHFGGNVVVGEIDLVVIRACVLCLVAEPRAALLVVEPAGLGHQGECAVVVDPRGRLVGLLDAPYFVVGVDVLPSGTVLASLRGPEVHAPWQGDGRIRVSGGKLERRLRAHERVHKVGR